MFFHFYFIIIFPSISDFSLLFYFFPRYWRYADCNTVCLYVCVMRIMIEKITWSIIIYLLQEIENQFKLNKIFGVLQEQFRDMGENVQDLYSCSSILTHLRSLFPFYISWWNQKTYCFEYFLGVYKESKGLKWVQPN